MTTMSAAVSLRQNAAALVEDKRSAYIVALLLAVAWWGAALYLRERGTLLVWNDQDVTFSRALELIRTPYLLPGFANPPWALIPLIPFTFLPLPIAVLFQLAIFFAALTAIVHKLGGGLVPVLLALTSPITFFVAMELNVEWIVALGLLVPRPWSPLFLLVKPQMALGYGLVFTRREAARAVVVTLALLLGSFALWGFWIPDMIHSIQIYVLHRPINFAPMVFITAPIAFALGAILCWYGWCKHDPVYAVIGWLFFVTYIAHYSLQLPFAMLAVRHPRLALIISVGVWFLLSRLLLPML
jgi:hypothetical protein